MKRFFSKLALSACLIATPLLASGTASAEGENQWGGLYAGAQLGYSIVDTGLDFERNNRRGPRRRPRRSHYATDTDADGFAGGAHIGYNHQSGKLVFGIEGDFSKTTSDVSSETRRRPRPRPRTTALIGPDFRGYGRTTTRELEVDSLASLRGRLGYAEKDTLLYITAGIAWAQLDLNTTVDYGKYVDFRSESENLTGFVIGGGAEYMITDGLSVRGEVLHYGFDDKGHELDATVARVGFSMKIN